MIFMANAFLAAYWDHISTSLSSVRSRRLSVLLDEKREFLEKLVMKAKNLEKETEHLEDSLLYVIFQNQQ